MSPQAETASQIETKKSDRAPQLYESLGDSNRIKQLIELGKKELRPTYSQNADRQKAILYFLQAEKISQTAGNQKWLEESRCLIGITHILGNNWKLGQPYFKQIIEARQQEGDLIGEINVLLRMSTTTFCDDCSENMTALNRALTLARKIGNKSLEMLILMEMGYEHFQLNGGDTREAEQKAHEVLTIQEEIGVFPLTQAYHTLAENSVYKNPGEYGYLSNAYYFMSDVSQARGDLNQKLFYVLKAVKEIEASKQLTELEYAYFKLGNAYYELGQYDKSTEYHQKSLALSRKRGVLFIQVGIVSRIAAAMLKKDKAHEALQFLRNVTSKGLSYTYEDKLLIDQCFGACYSALKQDRLAEKYYKKSVVWSKETTSWFQYIALWKIR